MLTVNVHGVNEPAAIVQVPIAPNPEGVLERVPSVSRLLKPPPVTVTTLATGPVLGMSVICGAEAVTVKVIVAISPVLPLTWIMCGPRAAVVETVKEVPVNDPLEIVHEDRVTISGSGVLVIVHEAASNGEKLEPDTITGVPTPPDIGLSVIDGGVTVPTMKSAIAIS